MARRPAPYLDRLRAAGLEVVHSGFDRLLDEAELVARIPGFFATIAGGEPYTERVFANAPDLRIVARNGVGWDKVDVEAATRHGVAVAMAFGTNHESVADGTFVLIGAAAFNLPVLHATVASGRWGAPVHPGLWRKTLGILGLGRIGRAVARRARGFEMRIVAYDPVADRDYAAANGIELVAADEVLRSCDFVSVHMPYTPETRNFIDASRLALMKPTAFLINTARGGLVDEAALADALRSGRLAGAGIDVFEREPPEGSPLLGLPNVVLLPHASGRDDTGELAMGHACADAILAYFRSENPGTPFILNPAVVPPDFKPSTRSRA